MSLDVFWNEIAIIDYPDFPFQPENKTEEKLTAYLLRNMAEVLNNEKRKNFPLKVKNINFKSAKSIFAIDIGSLESFQKNNLESLIYISKIHPFFLCNSKIPKNELRDCSLQVYLKENYFVIPVFDRIIPFDKYSSLNRYGDEFCNLIAGKKKKIKINDILAKNASNNLSVLLTRFPNIIPDNKYIKFNSNILWMGIDDDRICEALSYLFNNNIESFDYDELVEKFSLPRREFRKYINKSMLFDYESLSKIRFRFLRKYILLNLMSQMHIKFERLLIDKEAIISESVIEPPPKKRIKLLEYHNVSNIYKHNTNSILVISYIKELVKNYNYDKILLLFDDYQNEDAVNVFESIFPEKIVKMINFYGTPILTPFEDLSNIKNLVVITDVVNSGQLLNRACSLLKNKLKVNINMIFSFIVNNKYIHENSPLKDIKFHYYIEKRLQNVSNIQRNMHEEKFSSLHPHLFSFFWELIDSQFEVQRSNFEHHYINSKGNILTSIYKHKLVNRNFKPNYEFTLGHFYNFIKRVIKIEAVNVILLKHGVDKTNIIDFIKKVAPDIDVVFYGKVDSDIIISSDDRAKLKDKNILIFIVTFLLGERVNLIDKFLKNQTKKNIYLTLHKKKNMNRYTRNLNNNYDENSSPDAIIYNYYDSVIPYYLFFEKNHENILLENKLKEL